MGASARQRLDSRFGPFAEIPVLPPGHSAESLRSLPESALVALADARGDVNSRKFREAAGLAPVVKRAKRTQRPSPVVCEQRAPTRPRAAPPVESATYRAWHRAHSVLTAFHMHPSATLTKRLADARTWCLEWSSPVELDAEARRHLTPWELIAATWDGEYIADADRATLLLPFRNETHPKINPATREAILAARDALQSERPQSARRITLPPFSPFDHGDE